MAKPLSCLLVTIQAESGVTQKIVNESSFMIGRAQGSPIPFSEAKISRNHLLVKNKSGKVYIEDQGSSNGTFVNDQQIEPRRLIPLESTDRVRLGSTKKEFTFQVIERAYSKEALDEVNMSEDKRESVLNLIYGAQAEASRLINHGKEIRENLILAGEQRAAEMDEHIAIERDKTLRKAAGQAEEQIENAKTEGRRLIAEAQKAAIDKAKDAVEKFQNDARAEIARERAAAQREEAHLLAEAKLEGERRAKEYVETARAEMQQESSHLIKKAQAKAKEDRDQILFEAEEKINGLRLEIKRLEGERSFEKKRLETELQGLKAESDSQKHTLEQRRKAFEYELDHKKSLSEKESKAYYEARKKEIDTLGNQKLQAIERQHKLKEEEARAFVQSKMVEFDKLKRQAESELSALTSELKTLKPDVISCRRELENLRAEAKSVQGEAESLRIQGERYKAESHEVESRHKVLVKEVKELKTRRGQLALKYEELEKQVKESDRILAQRLAEQKTVIEQEMVQRKKAQDEELNQLRLVEMERLKRDRATALEELIRERQRLGRKIIVAIERALTKVVPVAEWRKVSKDVEAEINAHLSEKALIAQSDGDVGPLASKLAKGQKWNRMVWAGQGLALGLAVMVAVPRLHQRLTSDLDPVKTAAEERARQVQEDLERRRFNPPQDEELRETYAGSVIYTKDFLTNYLSPEFQKKWLKTASSYFLKQWRVQEETVVQALSIVNTLIETLDEKKHAIHPDFVNDGLKKMDDLEAESIVRIKELLGSEVRVEALRRLEKRTYTEFFSGRAPAEEPPQEESAAKPVPSIKRTPAKSSPSDSRVSEESASESLPNALPASAPPATEKVPADDEASQSMPTE